MTEPGTRGHGMRRRCFAAAAVVLIVGSAALAFGRDAVLRGGDEIHAIFADANQLKSGSAVRLAGLDIGEVDDVRASSDGRALVTMRLKPDAPPLHADARFTVQPRLAFEGNFYVRVDPGSPDASRLRDGATVPLRQTGAAVQLDEVLNVLDRPTLGSATRAIGALGSGLGGPAGATGAQGLRRTAAELDGALDDLARVAGAAQGQRAGDLPRALRGFGEFTEALSAAPDRLREVVTTYATVVRSFAANDQQLGRSLERADALLRGAPRNLRRLDAALPATRDLATALRPAIRALPVTQRSFSRALREFGRLVDAQELPRLLDAADPPLRRTPLVARQLGFLSPYLTSVSRCVDQRVMPVLDKEIEDGQHTAKGQKVWQELLHMSASLAGASSAFDANGTTIRAGLATGDNVVHSLQPGLGQAVTSLTGGNTGVRPEWLGYGKWPATRPDQECSAQPLVDLQAQGASRYTGTTRRGARITPEQRATDRAADLARLTDLQRSLDGARDAEAGR